MGDKQVEKGEYALKFSISLEAPETFFKGKLLLGKVL